MPDGEGTAPGATGRSFTAPADVPVVDCHAHLYDDPGGERGERLLRAARRLRIRHLIVSRLWASNRVPATATPEDFRRCNRAVY